MATIFPEICTSTRSLMPRSRGPLNNRLSSGQFLFRRQARYTEWETDKSGPARRVYRLTDKGERHLDEWATVLDHVSKSMSRFVKETRVLRSEG